MQRTDFLMLTMLQSWFCPGRMADAGRRATN
jgi:hypothetical protein